MDMGMKIRLPVHTRFRLPVSVSGLSAAQPVTGAHFQSCVRITLQINNDFLELVSLPDKVEACGIGW